MLLHGIIWSSWIDEYLKWKPSDYNNTYMISLETYKIWQPAFALYNSARSNGWFIHMNGVPATISNTGRVFAAGTFTFYVTCQFDFTNFPYDEQVIPKFFCFCGFEFQIFLIFPNPFLQIQMCFFEFKFVLANSNLFF